MKLDPYRVWIETAADLGWSDGEEDGWLAKDPRPRPPDDLTEAEALDYRAEYAKGYSNGLAASKGVLEYRPQNRSK